MTAGSSKLRSNFAVRSGNRKLQSKLGAQSFSNQVFDGCAGIKFASAKQWSRNRRTSINETTS